MLVAQILVWLAGRQLDAVEDRRKCLAERRIEGGPMGDVEQHEELRRIVRRIAQAPDAAGDAYPYRLRSVEGAVNVRQAGMRSGDRAGLVIPRDHARFVATQYVWQRYRVAEGAEIIGRVRRVVCTLEE